MMHPGIYVADELLPEGRPERWPHVSCGFNLQGTDGRAMLSVLL